LDAHAFSLDGAGYEPRREIKVNDTAVSAREHAILAELGRAAALCNDASLYLLDGIWTVEGNPMEGASNSETFVKCPFFESGCPATSRKTAKSGHKRSFFTI